MKKFATLALVLALGVAAVATTGCSADSTPAKTGTKPAPSTPASGK